MTTIKMQPSNGVQENGYARIARQIKYQNHSISLPAKLKTILKTKIYQTVKAVNAKHCVTALILLTLGTIIYYTHYVENSPFIGFVHYNHYDSLILLNQI